MQSIRGIVNFLQTAESGSFTAASAVLGISAVAVGKLLIHPLAVLLAVWLVGQTMGPLAPQLQWASVLLAAAPMLGIYAIVGQRYGRQAVHAASMLVATVASFATLAAVVGLLHWMWGAPPPQ